MHHLIILQSTVISLLRDRHNDLSFLIHPNHNSINKATKSARTDIVTALSEQYQRLSQIRPIARLPAPTPQGQARDSNCLETLTCTTRNIPCEGFSFGGGVDIEFSDLVLRHYSCGKCGWEVTHGPGSGRKGPKTKDGQVLDWKKVLDRFHHRDELRKQKNGYRCYLCGETNFVPTGLRKLFGPAGVYAAMWEVVEAHIRKKHYFEEFR